MELDDAYANAAHIPGAADYPPRWAEKAQAFRDHLLAEGRADLDQPYGDSPRQVFDLFQPEGTARGLCIFVHGGYWLRFDKSYWSHLAAGALDHGWAVALPSYDLCPEVRIDDITRQIALAVAVIAGRAPGQIALTGHSAGGHLVARMLDPGLLPPDVAARLHRVVPISPVADLRPLLQTSMNEQFALSPEDAAAESPVLMTERLDVPVITWVGAEERPAFLDQNHWLATAWDIPERIAPGKHHFDVIDALQDPDSAMLDDLLG